MYRQPRLHESQMPAELPPLLNTMGHAHGTVTQMTNSTTSTKSSSSGFTGFEGPPGRPPSNVASTKRGMRAGSVTRSQSPLALPGTPRARFISSRSARCPPHPGAHPRRVTSRSPSCRSSSAQERARPCGGCSTCREVWQHTGLGASVEIRGGQSHRRGCGRSHRRQRPRRTVARAEVRRRSAMPPGFRLS